MYIPGTITTVKITNTPILPLVSLGARCLEGSQFKTILTRSLGRNARLAAISHVTTRGHCVSQNCPIRSALNHEDSVGSSMFQLGGRREQTATVTVNMVITGHFVTDIRNATSIAATVPATVLNSKHRLIRR